MSVFQVLILTTSFLMDAGLLCLNQHEGYKSGPVTPLLRTLHHKVKLKLVWQAEKPSLMGPLLPQPFLVILISPCVPGPKSSSSPTWGAPWVLPGPQVDCRSSGTYSASFQQCSLQALAASLCWVLPSTDSGRQVLSSPISQGRKLRLRKTTLLGSHFHPDRLTALMLSSVPPPPGHPC